MERKLTIMWGWSKAYAEAAHEVLYGPGVKHDAHEPCDVCSGLDWLPDRKTGQLTWQPKAYWPDDYYFGRKK